MILVAGSANLDFVVRASHIPLPGETVLGRDFQTFPGGKGANQAIACARSGGAMTQMLLALGSDAFSAPIEASLRQANVALKIVRCSNAPTGTAFICVSDAAENAITVAPGANSQLRADDLPPLDDVDFLLMQLETPLDAVSQWAHRARAANVTVVLNAAPAQTLPRALLDLIDILIVNEAELQALVPGGASISEMAGSLNVPCVVVTLGARGCFAYSSQGAWVQPAFAVNAIDTTAAGDTFSGALIAALAADKTLPEALREASAAAALACTRLGAQNSIPMRTEMLALLAAAGEASAADEEAHAALLRYVGATETTKAMKVDSQ